MSKATPSATVSTKEWLTPNLCADASMAARWRAVMYAAAGTLVLRVEARCGSRAVSPDFRRLTIGRPLVENSRVPNPTRNRPRQSGEGMPIDGGGVCSPTVDQTTLRLKSGKTNHGGGLCACNSLPTSSSWGASLPGVLPVSFLQPLRDGSSILHTNKTTPYPMRSHRADSDNRGAEVRKSASRGVHNG